MDTTLSDVEVAIAAARAGAEVAMAYFGRPLVRHVKAGDDFATDADLAAERAIREVLATTRPGDGILGEELGGTGPHHRRWLVDPICGTANFAAVTPLFAINVALEIDGVTTAAAIAEPARGIVHATDGTTAFLRTNAGDQPLRPSSEARLVDVNMALPFEGSLLLDDEAGTTSFTPRVMATSLTLAWVAAGRAAAYVGGSNPTGSVHFGAGIAVCLAAGCVVTALDGSPLGPDSAGFIAAADEATHASIRRRLPVIGRSPH